jgi:xylan 1,4-beta-xylosidase
MRSTRRGALGLALGGVGGLATASLAQPARSGDQGNDTYLNPVLGGDFPDPTVLKDGEDYYLTHSAFDATPGLQIWHSRDLVNWQPLCTALQRPLGTVFACDLVRHGGRYFIYIPFMRAPWSPALASFANIQVIHADAITGPWSDPVDLGIGGYIDPGHAVDEHGDRWLFLSGVNRVRLAADGLSTNGAIEHVYDGWHYPDDWIVEGFSLEGPKITRRGGWFYLFSAVGGTSGPATGHMVIVARARSLAGPWENCPANPIVRCHSAAEPWHSRGHATAVEGPGGQWYLIYHGYARDYHTLGRQTLLEPIDWTADGWPVARGGDLSQPLPYRMAPAARQRALVNATADIVAPTPAASFGWLWTQHLAQTRDFGAVRRDGAALLLSAQGSGPADGTVITRPIGARAYTITATIERDEGASAGLLLYFNPRMFFGMGCDGAGMTTYVGGVPGYWREPMPPARRFHLRIDNDHHVLTYYWSLDGVNWTRHAIRGEASGCHANTMGELAALRPALYAAGTGTVRILAMAVLERA